MTRAICVYSSSSAAVAPEYFQAAGDLGAAIAKRGEMLVYGGCDVGLMGAVAKAAREGGGKIIGVVPEFFRGRDIVDDACDELIYTRDLRKRKSVMESRADAFIALPGGFGTLEELLEVLTLKQLQQHEKPIVVLNISGFYDPLDELISHIIKGNFAKRAYRQLYHLASSVKDAFKYLDSYVAGPTESKWF